MAIRLIDLSLLSGREAQDIGALLSKNGISVYETPRGNWGASMAAIWLADDNQLEEAQALLEAYRQTQPKKRKGRVPKHRLAIMNPVRSPLRQLLLVLSVAGLIVLLTIIASFVGEHISLGRSFDARGGMIELYILWTILFLFCVLWAVRYFTARFRKNNISLHRANQKIRQGMHITMNNIRVFQVLVISSFAIYVAWFFLSYWSFQLSDFEQRLTEYNGYGADLPVNHFLFYGAWFGLWSVATLGLFFFQNWGRHLFLTCTLLGLAMAPFSGFLVQDPLDALLSTINLLLDGAILAMAYLLPLSKSFLKQEN